MALPAPGVNPMQDTERSTVVAASPAAVWAVLLDRPGWQGWDPDIVDIRNVRGDGPGAAFDCTLKGGVRGTITFDTVEPERCLGWSFRGGAGLVRAASAFTLAAVPGGTRLTYRFGMRGPAARLLARLNAGQIVHGVEMGLENIAARAAATPA